jgi:hypothetical protein
VDLLCGWIVEQRFEDVFRNTGCLPSTLTSAKSSLDMEPVMGIWTIQDVYRPLRRSKSLPAGDDRNLFQSCQLQLPTPTPVATSASVSTPVATQFQFPLPLGMIRVSSAPVATSVSVSVSVSISTPVATSISISTPTPVGVLDRSLLCRTTVSPTPVSSSDTFTSSSSIISNAEVPIPVRFISWTFILQIVLQPFVYVLNKQSNLLRCKNYIYIPFLLVKDCGDTLQSA